MAACVSAMRAMPVVGSVVLKLGNKNKKGMMGNFGGSRGSRGSKGQGSNPNNRINEHLKII